MLAQYMPIVVLFALGFGFSAFSVAAAGLTGPKRYNKAKLDFYECGIEPTPQASGPHRFRSSTSSPRCCSSSSTSRRSSCTPTRWRIKALGLFGLVEVILFIVTVFVAYAYVWRRGGLDWD